MALVYFIIHLFFFSFVCVSLIIIIIIYLGRDEEKKINGTKIQVASDTPLSFSLSPCRHLRYYFFLLLYLVYIIFLLLFPILTRHAPSFFLASLKNRRGKMNRRMKYTLNNTVLFKKQSIKARHHLLRSIHFSRIFFWRGGGGHAMAVTEKRGSRKRESTRERDAKERVRVLKITE